MNEMLNYDSLVKAYYENLHTTLRRFSGGSGYLESWVHDENHERSLAGIFEAAEDAGEESVTVLVSSDVADSIDRPNLVSELEQMGTVDFKDVPEGIEISVRFGSLKEDAGIHPRYLKKLRIASAAPRYRGKPDSAKGTLYSATSDGVTLHCAIDDKLTVTEAKFEGGSGLTVGLMDKFCELLANRPLQEGAEHAAIRLEDVLADSNIPYPSKGIVSPEKADKIFATPQSLIRKIAGDVRQKTGTGIQWNIWEDSFSPEWLAASPEARVEKVSETLNKLTQELSLPYPPFEILAIKNDCRVILVQPPQANSKHFGHHLMVLERELQSRLEKRLELVLESLEDKNHRESRTKRENTFNDRSKNA